MLDTRRSLTRSAAWAALALAGAVLQGCQPPPAVMVAAPQPRLFATDFQGAAKSCNVPKVSPEPGKPVQADMKVTNDGGWCAISATHNGDPYAAGLLTEQPSHGKVYIHPVGNDTRIDYTPDLHFSGNDAFAVTLLPGHPVIRVVVAVTP